MRITTWKCDNCGKEMAKDRGNHYRLSKSSLDGVKSQIILDSDYCEDCVVMFDSAIKTVNPAKP